MKPIYKQFSASFLAGHSGSTAPIAKFNLNSGIYKIEVYSQGGASDASISLDQSSLYYQYYTSSFEPAVFALASPDSNGVLSFTLTASTNNASTSTGIIVITLVEGV